MRVALRHHTRRKTLDAIYVNYPEPPPDHGNPDEYLLTERFFRDAHAALRPGGNGLFVVSDNPTLLRVIEPTLQALINAVAAIAAP